ncbi:hypothetical protein AOQ84DRAFT_378327 [Glonium stellatum]|uniref:Uncharacterized protein n=1 Tax=Glonium stellatum TaxID=574774 RepID=A0A8E2JRS3_9PEZI|nr:hypothetical protein AOQ84DRAFT_378327 [Glonium stellatum]
MSGQPVHYFPQLNTLDVLRASANPISPTISRLQTIPRGQDVDARAPVNNRIADPTQRTFSISSHEGADARSGLNITSVAPPYDYYSNPTTQLDKNHQGGPYDILNPELAPNPSITDQDFQGGPYNLLNPELAPNPSITDQDFQGGPYDLLNPLPAPNSLTTDVNFPGGPYDFLNPLPAPNSLTPLNQGQHGTAGYNIDGWRPSYLLREQWTSNE